MDPQIEARRQVEPARGPINPRPVHGRTARPHPGCGSRCTLPLKLLCTMHDAALRKSPGYTASAMNRHPKPPTETQTRNKLNKPEPWNRSTITPNNHDHDDAMTVATLCYRTNHTGNGHFSGRTWPSVSIPLRPPPMMMMQCDDANPYPVARPSASTALGLC